ncbi:MAG TPA: glycosyltransferase family 2 protein [Candidatus Limnocylindrales bacterium]|jgi:glycosyltransferase involved in cell wall biosynthesis|nr:glycosyltransferase family 2 protein [Candidatus Limnocylindrales bacterium]
MTTATRIGLVINTSEQPDYLRRLLRAVEAQSAAPAEVLLADDGSGKETRKLFADWSAARPYPTAHVWQKKEGFRRARILNQAIAQARSDYLVFLDGDSLPHPQFLADHARLCTPEAFLQGHRALILEQAAAWFGLGEFSHDRRRALFAAQVSGWTNAFRWPVPLVSDRRDLRGIRGCNLGIWRNDLLRVNGYNEAFVGWGREDSELAVRLMNSGVRRRDARGWALCYHLWHQPASRAALPSNDELLAEAVNTRSTRCQSGVDQYLSAVR